jgi:hypothetical protein
MDLVMWGALSDEKLGLQLMSIPGGSCSCIYFPQEQGSPVIPLGIGFV